MMAYLGLWGSFTAGIWFLFSTADSFASEQLKAGLVSWLRRSGPQHAFAHWPDKFIQLFDSLFGSKHFSRKCVWRSFIASLTSFAFVSIIYGLARWDNITAIWELMRAITVSMYIIPISIVANAIPDYLSLLETRYMLSLIKREKRLTVQIAFLVLDLIISSTVFYFCIIFGVTLMNTSMVLFYGYFIVDEDVVPNWNGLSYFPEILVTNFNHVYGNILHYESMRDDFVFPLWSVPTINFQEENYGGVIIILLDLRIQTTPWLYSTFFTSVWIYLFLLGSVAIRTLVLFSSVIVRWERYIQLEAKPIAMIGYALILLITLIFILAAPFVL